MARRWTPALIGLIALLAAGGLAGAFLVLSPDCVVVVHDGATTHFRYAHWSALLLATGGLFIEVVACLLVARGSLPAKSLVATSIFMLFGIGLAVVISFERVSVNRAEFSVQEGLWPGSETVTVPYADLAGIEVYSVTTGNGRSEQTNYYMLCKWKKGGDRRFELSLLMQAAAEAKILQVARANQIPVEDKTGRYLPGTERVRAP
ncbi:MAG: hypothetical protein AB7K24_05985 [Gemmataceae bacterium]